MIAFDPTPTFDAPRGMVCAVDHLASQAGLAVLRNGGNAVDAAIATNAVLAVTTQQMCGMGGDLLAIVVAPGERPVALNASGFAGSGADAAALRRSGHRAIPRHDLAAVTVPGCVDGWIALAERFGSMPLAELLAPAERYAREGFPASPPLVAAIRDVVHLPEAGDYLSGGPLRPGQRISRPGVARTLEAIVKEGRAGFYEGEFGRGLVELGRGQFDLEDLTRPIAYWCDAVHAPAFGHEWWSVPPNSQGYLTLAAGAIASGLDLPVDPADPRWAHLLIEASRQAAFDRVDVLFEGADGMALLDEARLAPRRAAIDPERAAVLGDRYDEGGTIALTAVDESRLGITIVQSNASGFGARMAEPATRIFLHNRGLGFSLEEGHPAELAPGRRPPHTLCPTIVTRPDGSLAAAVGAAGGDGQPLFVLQILTRWLQAGERPGRAIGSGRFSLGNPAGGDFNSWERRGDVHVLLEEHVPSGWRSGLESRGHRIERGVEGHTLFGIGHVITVGSDGLSGATDPRALVGAVAAY